MIRKTVILILLLSQQVYCQVNEVKIIGKVKNNKILLRWAPGSPALWQHTNANGFILEKFKLVANGKLLPTPQIMKVDGINNSISLKLPPFTYQKGPVRTVWFSKFLTPDIDAKTEEEILAKENEEGLGNEGSITNDDYAVAWQSIYGKDYNYKDAEQVNDGIIQLSTDQERRYALTMNVAELNFSLANFLALGYEDPTPPVAGEKYLYKLTPNGMFNGVVIPPATIYIGLEDIEDPSKIPPYDFSVAFVDEFAKLNWNTSLLEKFYTSYDIYFKEGNKNFSKINTYPIINTGDENQKFITYSHNLNDINGKLNTEIDYSFYVVGRDPFGDNGKPSEIITGKVRLFPKNPPFISESSIIENTQEIEVKFGFDNYYINSISGFLVAYSNNANSGFKYINNLTIPTSGGVLNPESNQLEYTIKLNQLNITTSVFVKIVAVAKFGENLTSNGAMVQLVDNIAPTKPTIISITNTNIKKTLSELTTLYPDDAQTRTTPGTYTKIVIKWTAPNTSTDNDIVGYRLFRSNNTKEEPSQISNKKIIEQSDFNPAELDYEDWVLLENTETVGSSATVTKASLNSRLYYQIYAVDKNENQGDFSEAKFLQKPDVIPLPAVVIEDYSVGEDGIGFNWQPYSPDDPSIIDFDFKNIKILRTVVPNLNLFEHTNGSTNTSFNWQILAVLNDYNESIYFDNTVNNGNVYAYCVQTEDLSGNLAISKPLVLEYNDKINSNTEPDITNLATAIQRGYDAIEDAEINKKIRISWSHTSNNVVNYTIYRALSNEDLSEFKVVEVAEVMNQTNGEYFDIDVAAKFELNAQTGQKVHVPIRYKYGLMANYVGGHHSNMAIIEVDF